MSIKRNKSSFACKNTIPFCNGIYKFSLFLQEILFYFLSELNGMEKYVNCYIKTDGLHTKSL